MDEKDEVSIASLANLIAAAFHFNGELIFDTTKADGQFKKTASNARLRSFLPDFKFTPLNEAVQDTVSWFRENHSNARL